MVVLLGRAFFATPFVGLNDLLAAPFSTTSTRFVTRKPFREVRHYAVDRACVLVALDCLDQVRAGFTTILRSHQDGTTFPPLTSAASFVACRLLTELGDLAISGANVRVAALFFFESWARFATESIGHQCTAMPKLNAATTRLATMLPLRKFTNLAVNGARLLIALRVLFEHRARFTTVCGFPYDIPAVPLDTGAATAGAR
jgi:hypothetical protein